MFSVRLWVFFRLFVCLSFYIDEQHYTGVVCQYNLLHFEHLYSQTHFLLYICNYIPKIEIYVHACCIYIPCSCTGDSFVPRWPGIL